MRTVQLRDRPRKRFTVLFLVLIFAPMLGITLAGALIVPPRHWAWSLVVIAVLAWEMLCLLHYRRHPWLVRKVRQELRRKGHNICMKCGYWLRGLDDSATRCPECGTRIADMPKLGSH